MCSAEKTRTLFALSVEERAPLSITVSRRLREAIVSGKISLGTELPSEKDLAKELGVGRSTVREALRILQAQGLLSGGDTVSTQRPRVSAEQTLNMAAHTMENLLRLGQVPLRDLIELRLLIESAAMRQAAEHREPSAIADAREALEVMKAANVDLETFRAADVRFHRSLATAGKNVAFALIMGVLRNAISAHFGEALQRVPNQRATLKHLTSEHEAILAAVEQGRGKRAAGLVTEHVRSFYEAGHVT